MKTMILLALFSGFGIFHSAAQACTRVINNYRCNCECIDERWLLLGTQTVSVSSCRADEALALSSKTQSYPQMRGHSYNVHYWAGSFIRDLETRNRYLREIYDSCRGRLISSREIVKTEKSTLKFAVKNPNLEATVDASYKLAPMTDAEAARAYAEAEQSCRAYPNN